MSSSIRVNNILPASGTNVAIGTAGGTITYAASVSGVSTFTTVNATTVTATSIAGVTTAGITTAYTNSIILSGSTSGVTTVKAAATASGTLTLPTGVGSNGQVLQTDGTGVLSWSNPVQTVSSNYVIWVAPNGTKLMQAWGITPFNASGVATITFPVAFNSSPNVTASIYRGTTLSGYMMSTQIGAITTSGVTIIGNYTTGGGAGVLNLSSNESASWIAIGGVN